MFKKCDQWDAALKPDHQTRPLWVDDGGRIILESFSPIFDEAQDFLINIAEPQSRVSRMHEYELTTHSLFAAVSVGHPTKEILEIFKNRSFPHPTNFHTKIHFLLRQGEDRSQKYKILH